MSSAFIRPNRLSLGRSLLVAEVINIHEALRLDTPAFTRPQISS